MVMTLGSSVLSRTSVSGILSYQQMLKMFEDIEDGSDAVFFLSRYCFAAPLSPQHFEGRQWDVVMTCAALGLNWGSDTQHQPHSLTHPGAGRSRDGWRPSGMQGLTEEHKYANQTPTWPHSRFSARVYSLSFWTTKAYLQGNRGLMEARWSVSWTGAERLPFNQ